MMVAILLIAGLIVSVGAMGIWGLWGLPVALIVVLGLAAYFAAARREGEPLGTREREKPVEPTGRPRSASGDAETANERVGQA